MRKAVIRHVPSPVEWPAAPNAVILVTIAVLLTTSIDHRMQNETKYIIIFTGRKVSGIDQTPNLSLTHRGCIPGGA